MIEGVFVEKLKVMEDNRGKVMRMLRKDSPLFSAFGEIYFSTINFSIIKAWKKHLRMTQCFAVPVGRIKLVIFDDRDKSSTKGEILEIELGENNYSLVKIPPLVWYGFQGLSNTPALITNCADIPHDPDESIKLEHSDSKIPYIWK